MKTEGIEKALFFGVACFLPLFWVNLTNIAGFKIDLNFLAILLAYILFVMNVKSNLLVLKIPLITFLLFTFGYLFSFAINGEIKTLMLFSVQVFFSIGAITLGLYLARVYERKDGKRLLFNWICVCNVSFVFVFLLVGGGESIELIMAVLKFDSYNAVSLTRDIFGKSYLNEGLQYVDIVNFHNRVAQHIFGFSCLSLVLFMQLKNYNKRALLWMMIPLFGCLLSIVLLSGQVFAEILLTLLVVFFVLGVRNEWVLLLKFIIPLLFIAVIALILISFGDGDAINKWSDRASGGDLSTGRLDIWSYYLSNVDFGTTLFGGGYPEDDTHNLFLTIFLEMGSLGLLLLVVVCVYSLRFLVRICFSASDQPISVAVIISLSFILHFLLSFLISGGYGFPGFSEILKIPALVFGVCILSGMHGDESLAQRY